MRKYLTPISCLVLLLTLLSACEKKDVDSKSGSVEFSFNQSATGPEAKSAESDAKITSALVTIVDADGTVVYEKKKIELHSFNNEYISEPLSLIPANYLLTEFFILDQVDSVIYAAPVKGSRLAYLVKNPLAISIGIYKDEVTKVTPEVISTENKQPADFGYSAFGLSVIETFDFLVTVFTYNETIENYELASANLEINDDTTEVLSSELAAITNKITLSENYSSYEITITKPGFMAYRAELTVDSLKEHWNSPLTVLLKPAVSPTDGLIAYYPFDGNVNDYSGMENNCVDSTDGVYEDGIIGSALYFNGTTDYLTLENTLDGTYGLTFSFWINAEDLIEGENNGTIISKYNMYTDMNSFRVTTARWPSNVRGLHADYFKKDASTDYRDYAWSELTSPEDVPSQLDNSGLSFPNPTIMETGSWNHCVANLTDSEVQVWINGILCVSRQRDYVSYDNDDYEPTYIGNTLASGSGGNNHYKGLIDELRVYNRALAPEEIELLFDAR